MCSLDPRAWDASVCTKRSWSNDVSSLQAVSIALSRFAPGHRLDWHMFFALVNAYIIGSRAEPRSIQQMATSRPTNVETRTCNGTYVDHQLRRYPTFAGSSHRCSCCLLASLRLTTLVFVFGSDIAMCRGAKRQGTGERGGLRWSIFSNICAMLHQYQLCVQQTSNFFVWM